MKFETAKNLVKGFLAAGVACSVLALFMSQVGSTMAGMYLTMISLGCMLMCAFFVITALKCPWCGKRIIRHCFVLKNCPRCRRDLATGMKSKRKKSR
ncbi:MAG: hypothetical protein NC319_08320 [Butyricicoccus sp.]|nr:hypothetical protein [Butyricicoccus sp.]